MQRHDKYDEQLEEARKFEDYVATKLYQQGIVIGLYRSMAYQRKGESRAGFEIKYDKLRVQTGNLFIETEEKCHNNASWKPAGIYALDNSWLYVIGDYHKLWVFACTSLDLISDSYEKRETETSRGFLLPVADADKYAAKVIQE